MNVSQEECTQPNPIDNRPSRGGVINVLDVWQAFTSSAIVLAVCALRLVIARYKQDITREHLDRGARAGQDKMAKCVGFVITPWTWNSSSSCQNRSRGARSYCNKVTSTLTNKEEAWTTRYVRTIIPSGRHEKAFVIFDFTISARVVACDYICTSNA